MGAYKWRPPNSEKLTELLREIFFSYREQQFIQYRKRYVYQWARENGEPLIAISTSCEYSYFYSQLFCKAIQIVWQRSSSRYSLIKHFSNPCLDPWPVVRDDAILPHTWPIIYFSFVQLLEICLHHSPAYKQKLCSNCHLWLCSYVHDVIRWWECSQSHEPP